MNDDLKDVVKRQKTDEAKASVAADADWSVTFRVSGLPTAKGNLRAFPIRRRDGRLGVSMSESRRVADWVASVRAAAAAAYGDQPPKSEAVICLFRFYFPRPKSHYRGKKAAPDRLRPDAPKYMTTKPDIDKLARAVCDALKGVVFTDDAVIVGILALKLYCSYDQGPGVAVAAMNP